MMTARGGRPESIRHRLRNRLRERGEDIATGLQRYAAERFLYRLGTSEYRERFILKGATLFAIWGTAYRPTRDLDFTAYLSADPEDVINALRVVCNMADDVDELVFDTDAIVAEPIRDASEYHGLRVKIGARLGESNILLQVDIGFGNAIVPGPEEVEYRTMLGDAAPRILAYPQEAVVAEKLHAAVTLGERNSRYKDFYDLHVMAGAFAFDRETLVRAVKATFERRATPIPEEPPAALIGRFYSNDERQRQWRSYVNRNNLTEVPSDFTPVGDQIILLLAPLWNDISSRNTVTGEWPPLGPWRQA